MKSLLPLLCTSILALAVLPAQAQPKDDCVPIEEEIFPLRVPNFETPIMWKKVTGIDGPDQAIDLIALADGGFVVIGESVPYDKSKKDGLSTKQLYLGRVDINGKIIWEKRSEIKLLSRIAAGTAVKDRLAVLVEIAKDEKTKETQLQFYDGLGALKESRDFSDQNYNLLPQGIVSDPTSQTIAVALWAVNRKNPSDNFTILKKLSQDGKEISSRQYLPGVANRLESFEKTKTGDLVGSGRIETHGITSGWIIRTDNLGNILFQRPYARGSQSNLRKVIDDGQGNLIAVGDSVPSATGNRAAWIIKMNRNGSPLWEKFVQGRYAFSAQDVSMLPDGRIQVMVNGRLIQGGDGRDHVRLLSLTSYGKLIGDEAVIEGANAQARNLLVRDKSRIVTGITQSGLVEYSEVSDQKAAGNDFWILGLPRLGDYNDPCKPGREKDSFDVD